MQFVILLMLGICQDGEDPPGFSIWARGELWYAYPNGRLVITEGSRPGSGDLVRVGEEFGLRPRAVPGGELGASLGDHRLRASYLDLRFRGSDDLDQTLIFHGTTYPQGEEVRSEVDLPRLSLNYDYDFWDTSWTKARIGVVGHVYWVTARLTSSTEDERRTYHRGTAALSMSLAAKVGPLNIDADGSLGYTDTTHDLFGGIRVLAGVGFWNVFEVAIGYRWERFDASAETNIVALTIHGPTLALTLRF